MSNNIAEIIEKTLSSSNIREGIQNLEESLKDMPQVEFKTTHYFANGVYCREIVIPAGSCLTGMIHKTEHINIISKGDISVVTEDGTKRIQAPCTIISQPGTKRAGFAHTETVWTTIHPAATEDLDELERILIAPSHELLGEDKKISEDK